MGYIYQITNLINNKKYVGQTRFSIEQRWKQHTYTALNRPKIKYALYDAMRKYGIDNFRIQELEQVDNSQLNEKEKFYIKKLNSFIKNGQGYNLTLGGEGNPLIEINDVYYLWDCGKSIGEIADMTSHDRSSIRKILQQYENYSLKESNKRGDSIQGNNRHIPVYQFDLNGQFIQKYESRKQAEENTGIKAKSIWHAIASNGTAGGFQWCYFENINNIKPRKGRIYRQKVIQKDKESKIIAVYTSAAEASRQTGISAIQIRKVCQGKGLTAGGYYWEYK